MRKDYKMSRINICYASDELVAALHNNAKLATERLMQEQFDNSWLKELTSDKLFITKKFSIEDFKLKIPNSPDDKLTIYNNAVTLYEHLNELPGYVLADERFWIWLIMEKFYSVALATMQLKNVSTFRLHWIFTESNQRSLFYGVLSRLFFRVALSIDETLDDRYEYTRFAFDYQYRLRELTWRTYSSEKHIVRGALKGVKDYLDTHDVKEDHDSYVRLAKDISLLGSAKLLDAMPEEFIRKQAYRSLERYYSSN